MEENNKENEIDKGGQEKDIITFEELRTIQRRERTNDSLQDLGQNFLERVREYLRIKKRLEDKLSTREYENAKRVIDDVLDIRERKIVRLASLSARTKVPLKNLSPEEKAFLENMRSEFLKYHEFLNSKLDFKGNGEIKRADLKKGSKAQKPAEDSKTQEKSTGKELELEENKVVSEKEEPEKIEIKESYRSSNVQKPEGREELEDYKRDLEENGKEIEFGVREEPKIEKTEPKDKKLKEDGIEFKKIKITRAVPKFLGINLEIYGPYQEGDIAELPSKNADVLINGGSAELLENLTQEV